MSNSDEEIRRTESLLRQVTSSELKLLVTDLSLANTFLLRARTSRDEAARLRNRETARRAHEQIGKALERIQHSDGDADADGQRTTIANGLDALKAELQQLGEEF